MKDFEPALGDFSEAIRLDPTSAQARMERGRVLALLGEFDKALDDCAQAIRIDKNFVPALVIRGGVMIRQGDYEAALLEFNQAIRTNPRYAKAYNDRGVAHSKLGNARGGHSRLLQSDRAGPRRRAGSFKPRQRLPTAAPARRSACAISPMPSSIDAKYAAMYSLTRGLVEAGRGNFRQAIADYAVALAIDPRNRAASAAQADAWAKRDSDFVVATEIVTAPVAVATPESAALIDLDAAVAELEAESEQPAEETQLARKHVAAPDTQLALPAHEEESAEQAAFRAEQRKFEEMDRQKRLQALEEKAAEIRKRNELEEAKRQAQSGKPNKKKRRQGRS